MTCGRNIDSLFHDPVLNGVKVGIWIINKFYETRSNSYADRLELEPGLSTEFNINKAATRWHLRFAKVSNSRMAPT